MMNIRELVLVVDDAIKHGFSVESLVTAVVAAHNDMGGDVAEVENIREIVSAVYSDRRNVSLLRGHEKEQHGKLRYEMKVFKKEYENARENTYENTYENIDEIEN